VPFGSFVHAACGQFVELGEIADERAGRPPSECPRCISAVALTETLIERYDARVGN
jgi:hypothetical protein